MGCVIGEIGTDQESDRQNSLHEDLNEILSEEKLKEGLTDQLETSLDPSMIVIVDDEKIQKRKAYRIPQNTRKTHRGQSVSGLKWAEECSDLIQIVG